jgi:hypothetical protein
VRLEVEAAQRDNRCNVGAMSPMSGLDRRRPSIGARSARAAVCLLVGLLGASCNAILGLDQVHRAPDDGGAGHATGGGSGGGVAGNAPGGRGGAGGAAGIAGPSCGRELLIDGDFEQGMKPWNEAPTGATLVRTADDPEVQAQHVTPQSGSYLLRLGAPTTGYLTHYVERYVELPADASEVTISGYLQVRTEEDPDQIYDTSYVQLVDEHHRSSPFFTSDPLWSNLTPASDWTKFSFPLDVTSIAGEEMVFQVVADLDNGRTTYFYFDSLSVAVTGCVP